MDGEGNSPSMRVVSLTLPPQLGWNRQSGLAEKARSRLQHRYLWLLVYHIF
jgi:hypothetical protein